MKALLFRLICPTDMLYKENPKAASYGFVFPMFSVLVFVLQQSLDKSTFGIGKATENIMRCFIGFCAGALVSVAVAGLLYGALRFFGTKKTFNTLLAVVNLSWTIPLAVNLCGLVIDIAFQTKTAVIFGFGGALLSLMPLYEIVYTLFGEHEKANRLVPLVWMGCGFVTISVCGLALLLV